MDSTKELIDDVYRERVLRARRTPIAQKILAGADLFDSACDITLAGIRNQFSGADEARAQAIPRERLVLARRLGSR